MIQFTVHAAKTQLSRLIDAALAGEEVVIARGSIPVVRLVPLAPPGFRLGLLEGRLGTLPDFLAPLDPEDLARWEGAGETD